MIKRPNRIKLHRITCIVCGAVFEQTGKDRIRTCRQTCSEACSTALRSRQAKCNKAMHAPAAVEKASAGRMAHPHTGAFESNASAKEWRLRSPTGDIYIFRNLALFLRQNPALFEPDDLRPMRVGCRAQQQLRRLRPEKPACRQAWKGWTWVD